MSFPDCTDCKGVADPMAVCEGCRRAAMCDECATANHELCPKCRPTGHRYRYTLVRTWDRSKPTVTWVCLNPSTADDEIDDPTVRKIKGFSQRWGFGQFLLVNLFPLRATKPADLVAAEPRDRIGPIPHTSSAILHAAYLDAQQVVFAWGANGSRPALLVHKLALIDSARLVGRSFVHLGLTNAGEPKHPLMLPYATERVPWEFS